MDRSSGILMPLSSLPSPYGIGTLGKEAYRFIDFLHDAGQKYWQLLPLGPTSHGDSPYSGTSTFAGNPYYIDLNLLIADGLLQREEVESLSWGDRLDEVDYNLLFQNRYPLLRKAFSRISPETAQQIADFRRENASWLESYALYMALKEHFGNTAWIDWPEEEIRRGLPEARKKYLSLLQEDVDFWIFTQYEFFRQWKALKDYAAEQGIRFIGDLPIYVPLDSADVWAEPQFFLLDENNVPKEVAGCPPDDFNEEGQLWGNPLYDYEKMEKDGFGWWIRRMEGAVRLYDVIRIDHFRGLESYWAVPYGAGDAKGGTWRKGPGMKLVGVLTSWFYGTSYIAEDLGFITSDVRQLLTDSGLPGMKVLEFAFDSQADSLYLPHRIGSNSACYLGTHDNNTVLGWLEELPAEDREFARDYMHITEEEGWVYGMIRTGMASCADLFVVQMQDVLELDGSARMNVPGVALGNWRWRMLPNAAAPELAERLRKMVKAYRR